MTKLRGGKLHDLSKTRQNYLLITSLHGYSSRNVMIHMVFWLAFTHGCLLSGSLAHAMSIKNLEHG
jgi:hypothetical protein